MPTVQEIAERLARLAPEAQAEALGKLERNITSQENKRQKTILDQHKSKIASAMVDTLQVYCREAKVDIVSLLPLKVGFEKTEKGIAGSVVGRGTRSGGNGVRGVRFLKANGVEAIEVDGKPIPKCTETAVLKIVFGVKEAEALIGEGSAHKAAVKPESVKAIRERGFVAVLADGSKRPLADLYKEA